MSQFNLNKIKNDKNKDDFSKSEFLTKKKQFMDSIVNKEKDIKFDKNNNVSNLNKNNPYNNSNSMTNVNVTKKSFHALGD